MKDRLKPSLEGDYYSDMAFDLVALHKVMMGCPTESRVKDVEVDKYIRARLSTQTRVFQTCVDATLVPVADLLNHSPTLEPGVLWNWDNEENCMIISAVRAHAPGEELHTSYGSRSNMLLYRTYGFTHHPEAEPGWTYIARTHLVRPVLNTFLDSDARPQMIFESSHIDESLCNVLNDVAKRNGNATEFLRLVCARCRWPYEWEEKLQPAIASLKRVRASDPESHAWWSCMNADHQKLVFEDSFRVIMSEYLCLTAYLEACDVADGKRDESMCFRDCSEMRGSLVKALGMLRTSKGFSIQRVSKTPATGQSLNGGYKAGA